MRYLSIILLCTSLNVSGQDYFPLEVGNYWVYESTSLRDQYLKMRWEIISDSMADTRTYYKFEIKYFDEQGSLLSVTQYNFDSLINQTETGGNYLFFDSVTVHNDSAADDTSWFRSDYQDMEFNSTFYDNALVMGYSFGPYGWGYTDSFIDKIGLVERWEDWLQGPSYTLVEWSTQYSQATAIIKKEQQKIQNIYARAGNYITVILSNSPESDVYSVYNLKGSRIKSINIK